MTAHDWQDPEAPEGDATEQSQPVDPDDVEDDVTGELPREADEADALEQTRTVPTAEDDYRG
ncbi:hypothetical protein Afil01_23870 [Actinorhabdospora filicis]|uniref:Uncharacterized protein n=1 Tax=Actinorhabdospora filicis TaxID=1785913 RepID=A0A9W6SKH6_9ACTN|nr:hypothetical protein [Actinorhabdospora filicis]GLZ77580.1 hypothetical protein Afil01_23870 [Actinorhabdospora filicis]